MAARAWVLAVPRLSRLQLALVLPLLPSCTPIVTIDRDPLQAVAQPIVGDLDASKWSGGVRLGWRGEQRQYPEAIGDQDGDGFDDLLYWTYPPDGNPNRKPSYASVVWGGEYLEPVDLDSIEDGVRVVLAGDVNGDGVEDLVRLLPSDDEDLRVGIIEGGARWTSLPAASQFIAAPQWVHGVVAAGDVDADGFADMLFRMESGRTNVLVYGAEEVSEEWGALRRTDFVTAGAIGQVGPMFGDFDGDGFSDFATKLDTHPGGGGGPPDWGVAVHYGHAGGWGDTLDVGEADAWIHGEHGVELVIVLGAGGSGATLVVAESRDPFRLWNLGGRLAANVTLDASDGYVLLDREPISWVVARANLLPLGDLDGDGYAEFSRWLDNSDSPRMALHYGPANGASDGGEIRVPGRLAFLLAAGDLNGDGYDDIVVESNVGYPLDGGDEDYDYALFGAPR